MGPTDVTSEELVIEDLDHLGLVARVVDQIGLVECIDARLGTHEDEHLSAGQVLKAMILNGLGFVSAPMYLFSRFFEDKPTEHLLGEGVRPAHLNDDKLGRVLDSLHEARLSSLFVEIASEAISRLGVDAGQLHLDATSFHLHGRYPGQREEQGHNNASGGVVLEEGEPEPIRIRRGYSRDHRPDLRQFVVDLMCSGDGGIPLFFRAADGNDSDAASFASLICEFRAQVNIQTLFVADAALYTQHNLRSLQKLRWVSRVPQTLNEARALLEETDEQSSRFSSREGYRVAEMSNDYAGVAQRWVIVASQARQERLRPQLDKKLDREHTRALRELRKVRRRRFACEADARQELEQLEEGLRFHRLENVEVSSEAYHTRRGRPSKGAVPNYLYRITAELMREEEAIERARSRAGRFVLATNVVDEEELCAEEVLEAYLEQGVVERGFKFLKDPMFFADSVFLNSPRRVAALAMVMGLCLLVYGLGQRMLRRSLDEREEHIPDQKGKPTQRPTLRWVFQLFQAVHLVWMGAAQQIVGLNEERKHILKFFSPQCRRYYLLS
jgi:transposase